MSPRCRQCPERSSATCPVAADQGSLAMVVTMLRPALVSAVGLLTILLLSVGVHRARGGAHPTPILLLTRAFLGRNTKRRLCHSQESLAQVPHPRQCWQLGLRSPWVQKQDCIAAALKVRLA